MTTDYACREAMASDLMAAFAQPVPGKPVMLVSRDWAALYLRDEISRLEGEVEDADQAVDAARVEVRGLTGNARGQATRRADRAAADAYAARRELDTVRAVARRFGLEEVAEAAA
jgi:hypothetical protein